MKKYTKREFYKLVYEKLDRTIALPTVEWMVKAVFYCMEDILKDGDALVIPESFSLRPILKEERTTGNFGKPMKIPPRYQPLLKPSVRWIRICKAMEVDPKLVGNKQTLKNQAKSKYKKKKKPE